MVLTMLNMKRALLHFRKKFLFQKVRLLFFVFFLISGRSWSAPYYSGGNNAPNLTASWWTNADGTGTHPGDFITPGNTFIIQAAHTMTTTAVWAVSGAGSAVQVNGTLVATFAVSAPAWTFAAGSTYQHVQNGGTIPTAAWDPSSNCNITGITSSTGFTGGLQGQTFGNFTWNCIGQTSNFYMASNFTVAGNFSVLGTGSFDYNYHVLRMSEFAIPYTINVSGSFVINNNSSFKMNNGTGSCIMNVGGNFTLNSGYFTIVTGAANSTLSVTGDVSILGGTLSLHEDNSATVGTLNVGGNFTLAGGSSIIIDNVSTGLGVVNFNNNTTHVYSKTGGTISNKINFAVLTGSILDVGTSVIDGSTGTFTLNSGAGIITANAQGLTAGTGSIQVAGTKTFSTGADYTYNGAVAQLSGNGLTGARNLTINNTSTGVILSNPVTVTGTLTLMDGILTTSVANLLSVTNTSNSSISGGSVASFINGPVRWTLPSSLGSGSAYNFPLGKGVTYLPFSLVNPTTGAGAVTAQAEAFTADPGGSNDATLATKSATEYWALVTAGSFTNSSVSLTRQTAISPLDAIGGCTTVAGTYTSLAGTAGTYGVTGSNAVGINRYFVLAARRTISTGAIAGSPFCAGSNVSVPFTITGTFTAGNVFTAQLSDASGSFSSPVQIGMLTSTTAGTIPGTIPPGTLTGTLYRIRVVSSSPAITGKENGSDLSINPQPAPVITGTNEVCPGTTGIHYSTPPVAGHTYVWTVTGSSSYSGGSTNEIIVDWPDICSSTGIVKVAETITATGCSTTTGDYIVTIRDIQAPVVTTVLGSLDHTLQCSNAAGITAALALAPLATDNCTALPVIHLVSDVTTPDGSCANAYVRVRTWNFTDGCGNTSANFVQTITVIDNTAPVITTVAGSLDANLQCSNAAGITAALALAPLATDNCTALPVIHLLSDITTPDGTCANAYVRVRTWNFTDGCGNTSANFVQTITVIDNTAPVITTVAGSLDANLQCSNAAGITAALALAPLATDNCTALPVIHLVSDVTTPDGSCANAYVRVRTWNFTDGCGNTSANFVQTITVIDNTAPVITTVAGSLDANLQCSNAAGITAALALAPLATDNCTALPVIHLL